MSLRGIGIRIVVGAFLLVGATYAVVTPLFEASDELWHYPMVQTLASGNSLPVLDADNPGPWRQEAGQPPLYYGLMAVATRWVDQQDMTEVRWLNPHVDNGVVTEDGNTNLAIHTSREAWPWRGSVLALRLIRLLSVGLAAVAVYLTYRLALELEPARRDLALAAAATVGFTPMFAFIAGSVNNDNLAAPLSAAALLLMVHLAKATGWGWYGRLGRLAAPAACLSLGVLLGLAALTKESTLGLVPLAALTLFIVAFTRWQADGRRNFGRHLFGLLGMLGLMFGTAAAVAGWWYARNLQLYGDVLGWNAFVEVLGRRARPATLWQLWGEREGFLQSYWGLFGGVNVPMPTWTYTLLNAAAVAAFVGVGIYLVQKVRRKPLRLSGWVPLGLAIGWLLLVVLGLIRWATITWSSQGRLIFPAIPSLAVVIVFGLAALVPRRWQAWFLGVWVSLLFGLSVAAPFLWIRPAYAPPSALDPQQLAVIPNPSTADFGGEMRLLGFEVVATQARPGETLAVDLYWRSQIAMDRDWSVFVHLVDEHGIVVAQRDKYPGLGRLPTRLFSPGQAIADRYVVRLPQAACAPSRLQVVVGLYDATDGVRLPVGQGDSITLASVDLLPHDGQVPNPLSIDFGHQMRLVGFDYERRAMTPGETLGLRLYWQGLRPMDVNYTVFTHVRGQGERLWAQSDAWPQAGAAPTGGWRTGQTVEDEHHLPLQADTPPGVYDVEVGVYNGDTGKRLQVVTEDGRWTEDFVYLCRIRVGERGS